MIEPRPSSHRLMSIQALRGFAILLIVLSHVVGRSFDFGGESGVCLFFVISGFVLSLAYTGKVGDGLFDSKRFIVRQLVKFYPLTLVSILFGVLAQWHAGNALDCPKLLANLLLVQTWFCSERFALAYFGTSWFLCDILFFYLIFKSLNIRIMRVRMSRLFSVCAIIVALYAMCVVTIPDEKFNWTLYTFPVFRLIDCCIGIMLYRFVASESGKSLFSKTCKQPYSLQCLGVSLLLLLFCLTFFAYRDLLPVNFRGVALFWPFAIIFILYLMAMEKHHPRFFSLPVINVFTSLGNLSMEIFLTHDMAIYMVNIIMLHLGLYYSCPFLVVCVKAVCILALAWLARKCVVDPLSHRFA